MLIPSRLFYGLWILGLAIAILLGIWQSVTISLTSILIYDAILLILAIGDGLKSRVYRIHVKRKPIGKLSVGRDNPITISVTGKQKAAQIILKDFYPIQFRVSQEIFFSNIKPQETQELTYTISPDQRGKYEWEDIQIRQLSQWGLVYNNWKITAREKVKVYPDLLALRALSIRLTLEQSGVIRQVRRLGIGTEFAELREYRNGDDTRLIDWKATARRSRPIIRILEAEKEQTLIILLDRGRLMTAQVQGMKRFDWALNATLSLALAGLHRGDLVGIAVFDKEIIQWIPPQKGQHLLTHFMETLTPIEPVLLEPDYVETVTTILNQQTRRALVVMLTDIIDSTASAELLNALGKLTPRYLPFCVALKDPEIDKIAHNLPTISNQQQDLIKQAYNRAVALDLLHQRQLAFAQLKQKGVLVLDAPANQISERLVNRYLEVKRIF